jgi:hypothetical protein
MTESHPNKENVEHSNNAFFRLSVVPHVEAGKNASTIIPANCKRRRNGNPVVSDEIVMYGYESSATLATDKVQARPLVREGTPRQRAKQFSGKKKGKSKIRSWAPKGCPTPRYRDWQSVVK